MKYPEDFINRIICGDCLEVMKEMPSNSIDTIITDPPYGLEFMGKEWDKFGNRKQWDSGTIVDFQKIQREDIYKKKGFKQLPVFRGFHKQDLLNYYEFVFNWATEALRVAKPGATLLCFGGTRTYHRLACAIEDAGWILKDCIMWLYGSGFPKATDIGKQLQKQSGKKPNITGRNPNSREKCDKSNTLYESGTVGKTDYITEPTDKNAILWDGWKSHGLKPAYEPILVCMKPNQGSYANNALKWGVAGLNIDGGRISIDLKNEDRARSKNTIQKTSGIGFIGNKKNSQNTPLYDLNKGRYHANVILECICDEVKEGKVKDGKAIRNKSGGNTFGGNKPKPPMEDMQYSGKAIIHTNSECLCYMLDEQSGERKGMSSQNNNANGNIYRGQSFINSKTKLKGFREWYNDSGGVSRFFYCAKSSKAERNRGCEGLEKTITGHRSNYRCKICGHQKSSGSPCKCENPEWEEIPLKPQYS
ncbi:site-specific DNA-methyltransferase, partial [Candidatus Atribacteria bacterium 1244-E10-H5-B2]